MKNNRVKLLFSDFFLTLFVGVEFFICACYSYTEKNFLRSDYI